MALEGLEILLSPLEKPHSPQPLNHSWSEPFRTSMCLKLEGTVNPISYLLEILGTDNSRAFPCLHCAEALSRSY